MNASAHDVARGKLVDRVQLALFRYRDAKQTGNWALMVDAREHLELVELMLADFDAKNARSQELR